ncbi:hypothetical protein [Holospora obtusa]|nr:hypothetical protein [Holospora obtusa]
MKKSFSFLHTALTLGVCLIFNLSLNPYFVFAHSSVGQNEINIEENKMSVSNTNAVLIAFREGVSLPGVLPLSNEIKIILQSLEGVNTEAEESLKSIQFSIKENSENAEVLKSVLKKLRAMYQAKQVSLVRIPKMFL